VICVLFSPSVYWRNSQVSAMRICWTFVTISLISRRLFILSKQMLKVFIAHQFLHRRAAIHTTGRFRYWSHVCCCKPDHAAIRRRFRSATSSRGGGSEDTLSLAWLLRLIVYSIQVGTIRWPQRIAWVRPEVPRCHERGTLTRSQAASFYKVQQERIKRDVVGGAHSGSKFPAVCFCQE